MGSLDVACQDRACSCAILYLNKAETRDKICWAIQYGSKFFINDLHALISPSAPGTPLPLIFLGKSKNAFLYTFLFLDQIVWLGRTGIYKDKERVELMGRISLFSWLGASFCTSVVEIAEIGRLSSSIKKLEKELKNTNKYKLACFNWHPRKLVHA